LIRSFFDIKKGVMLMLSDRRQRVLAALIEEYVAYALPVGSRTLVERHKLGVSPATVRNELSVLEEAGYISQPHTSAGRIPTDTGYRSFVDELLRSELDLSAMDESTEKAVQQLRDSASELDDLMEHTSAALAHLTDCLSIVLPPSTLSLNIRQLSLLSLTPYRVLIVVVSDKGRVLNRAVDFDHPIDAQVLAHAQDILSHVLVGHNFREMKNRMDLDTISALRDPLIHQLLSELFICLQEGGVGHAHKVGLSTLIQQPEFQHPETLAPVLQLLENNTVMVHLLDNIEDSEEPVVRIGKENDNECFNSVSVVAAKYGRGDDEGVVAVIGPTRMNYVQVIRAVRAAQRTLKGE
jgi:heat-inducible transcriptional repressor